MVHVRCAAASSFPACQVIHTAAQLEPVPACVCVQAYRRRAHTHIQTHEHTLHVPAGADPSGLTWQPWADQLVGMVLGALVWGGLPLQEGCPAEHSSLLEAVSAYMAARPMQVRGRW